MNQVSTAKLIEILIVFAVIGVFILAVTSNREPKQLLYVNVNNFDECASAGFPIMESYPEQCSTPDGRTFSRDVPVVAEPINGTSSNDCVIGGCSSQLCGERKDMEQIVSTCEYRAEYACYEHSVCERQVDKECGWTQTPNLKSCLANPREQDAGLEEVF